jgi:flagellar basal body-associated protein FliL
MEDNLPVSQPVQPVQAPISQAPLEPKSNSAQKYLLIIFGVILIMVIAVGGLLYFVLNKKTSSVVHNAQVYNVPTTAVPTPQLTIYQVNAKDVSNQAIDQDTQNAGQNIDSLNSDLNNVDQSFNDQQTNLQ